MSISQPHLLLVGCGNMGQALISGWLKAGIAPKDILVIEPNRSDFLAQHHIRKIDDVTGLTEPRPEVVIFAVKPQALESLLPYYSVDFTPSTLFISIAAGKPIRFFKSLLGPDRAIVRAMPNTPALIGKGITAAYAVEEVTNPQKVHAERLLSAAGKLVWVEEETQLDAVTALSGSGPAYVFYFLECLIEAGQSLGLSASLAKELAVETLIGSAELASASKESLEKLRQNVTSPGGTTAAALSVLSAEDGLKPLILKTLAQAQKRAVELAS